MKKSCLLCLFLMVVMLITSLPAFASFEFSFTGSSATFFSVSEDGTETEITESTKGTVRAKMSFVNTTFFAQEVSLYLCTRDAETGRPKQINVKTTEIKPDGVEKEVSIDLTIEDETAEKLYLYVWNSDNAPFCEPAVLGNSKTFTIYAKMTNTYKNDSRLITGKIPRVQLELYNAPTDKELAKYLTYNEFYDNSVDTYMDMLFKVSEGSTNASQYIGCFVVAKLRETDKGNLEIESITTDTAKTKTLTVNKDNFCDLYTDGNSISFEYWKDIIIDVSPASIDISADANVYLNGAYCGKALSSEQINDYLNYPMNKYFNGSIQFSGRANGNYDVVYINQYEYGMVADIDVQNEAIELDNGYVELAEEYNIRNFIYNIYKNGNKITLSDIKKDDILSFAWPLGDMMDARHVDVYVSDTAITGVVTDEDNDNNTVYINDIPFRYVPGLSLSTDEGKFFFTHDGKIYSCKNILSDNYAYILNVARDDSFDESYLLKVLKKNDRVATYTVADKVNVTAQFGSDIITKTLSAIEGAESPQSDLFGNTSTDTDIAAWNIPDMLAESADESIATENASKRLITFRLNSEGEINKIVFAASNGIEGQDFNVRAISGNYNPATSRLGNHYFTNDTTLFYAPVSRIIDYQDPENYYDDIRTYSVNEDDIEVFPFDSLYENGEVVYNVYAYAIQERTMGATLIAEELSFMGRNNPLAVVTSVAAGLNSEGETATEITMFQSGQKTSYCLNEDIDDIFSVRVGAGDIIQYVLDIHDEIWQLDIIYDYEDADTIGTLMTYSDKYDKIHFTAGYVLDYRNSIVSLGKTYKKDAAIENYFFTCDELSTLAMVDVSREGAASFVKKLTSPSEIKYTNTTSSLPIQYYMVARVVDGDIVDAVEYNMGQVDFIN